MHAAATNPKILADLTALAAEPPRSIAEQMADIFVANEQEGRETTRTDLLREGFTDLDIDGEWSHACTKARKILARLETRDINAAPAKTLAQIEQDIVDVITSQLPPAQLLIAECQARGIAKPALDLLFHKARARAALGFANGKSVETH